MKNKFTFKTRDGWQSHNGNGGSTYSSSCTFYILFVNGKQEKEFDCEWVMYEYINKTYFPKKYKTYLSKIKKLEKDAEIKKELALKLDQEMKSIVLA